MTENIHKFYTGFGNLDDDDEITNILFDNVCDKTIIDAVIDTYTRTYIPNNSGNRPSENPLSIIYLTKALDSCFTPLHI